MTLTKQEINLAVAAYHNYCESYGEGGWGFTDFTLMTQSPEFELGGIGKKITEDELKQVAEKAGYQTTDRIGPERAYACRSFYTEEDLIEAIMYYLYSEEKENTTVEIHDLSLDIDTSKLDLDEVVIQNPFYGEEGVDNVSDEELLKKALKQVTKYSEEEIDDFVEMLFNLFDVELYREWRMPE